MIPLSGDILSGEVPTIITQSEGLHCRCWCQIWMLLGSKISVIVGTRVTEKTNIYQHVIVLAKDLEIVNLTIILTINDSD